MRRSQLTDPAILAAVLVLAVTGCATPAGPPPHLQAVAMAAEEPGAMLRAQAQGGDPKAQLALSLALAHGLHGLPRDPLDAQAWRVRATAARGGSVVAYTAPFRGHPGHVRLVPTRTAGFSPFEADLAERCAQALAQGGDVAAAVCGPGIDVGRLGRLWRDSGS